MDPSKLFQETDRAALIARIKTYPFGLVVTVDSDGNPKTAHVPVLLENRADGTFILFHLTRNNVVCQPLLDTKQCLCIFTGPNAYISPDWYGIPDQVPTWNYLSAECGGPVRRLDPNELVSQLDSLSENFEHQLLPKPVWTRAKMKDGKFEAMQRAIIGFEMCVESLQGTTKINQNKSEQARKNVIKKLQGNPIASAMKNSDDE